jgi:ribosomal protein L7/L12
MKRKNKSKEELIKELKNNQKFQEKMAFTREKFFPALCEATTSIDDALQNLSIINTVLMEKFLGQMKEKKFADINIADNLDTKDSKYGALKAMLELFNDMSLYDAKDLLEGMRNEINLFLTEENKSRSLAELKTKWIDEL